MSVAAPIRLLIGLTAACFSVTVVVSSGATVSGAEKDVRVVTAAEQQNGETLQELILDGAGTLSGGRHVKYPVPTPLANMNLSLLDKLGVPTIESIGDSTGRLDYLAQI